jgi:transcriptional regulator with GAF, ATPase, and Fis domain
VQEEANVTEPTDDRERLGRAFVELADTLVDDYDIVDLLDRLVGHSVELLAADAAGILLADTDQQLRVMASSSEDAELMELMQLQNDQGPCLDCYRAVAQVSVADLTEARQRWPRFVDAVAQRGAFQAVHALPLRLRGQAIGALNLFSTRAGALRPTELALGQALADVATISILQERAIRRAETLSEQLQIALNSRLVIEQAKGVLRHHSNLTMDSAFDRLRRYARSHNLRLSQVARDIVEGHLDPTTLTSTPTRHHRT